MFLSNFRTIDVVPKGPEFLDLKEPYIRKNIIKGNFWSVEDYLDIHFRLLREDFIGPIRTEVLDYFEGHFSANKSSKIKIYEEIKLIKNIHEHHGLCHAIMFPNRQNLKVQIDEEAFKFGSLLLFIASRNEISFTALVIDTQKDSVLVSFDHYKDSKPKIQENIKYVMILCNNFFAPYHYVLSVLQDLNLTTFPMERYIINLNHDICCPRYLHMKSLTLTGKKGTVNINPFDFSMWPSEHFFGFNKAQYIAFVGAIMHEFAIIQGPPGTGKTFLARQVAICLLQNSHLWCTKTPMLIISYTNHALDQFLEGLTHFTQKMLRMGGRCESPKLEKCTYYKYKNTHNIRVLRSSDTKEIRKKREMLAVMRTAEVVGMTTTFAARYHDVLECLGSPIVIVEEAAEVLESHVTASLNKNCQHLLMFGDHQQLQPLNADYKLRKYNLGISLFERMVLNDMECLKLNVQYRMRPEISSLIRPAIYKDYIDDDRVLNLPEIRGMSKSLYFISHTKPDKGTGSSSQSNGHEAYFLIELAKYLLWNGYSQSEITVLATYSGQVALLKSLQDKDEILKDVRMTTVDNYQGEESRIILLSLVRSNRSKSAGFLKEDNRICVALSRAKEGFYIIGNIELFQSCSQTWKAVAKVLNQQKSIGPYITLKCQGHGNLTHIQNYIDFQKTHEGGCNKLCMTNLKCGHKCKWICHGPQIRHETYKCNEICGRRLCDHYNHEKICTKKCFEPCGLCMKKVVVQLVCGHYHTSLCYDESYVTCNEIVDVTTDCGCVIRSSCHSRGYVKCTRTWCEVKNAASSCIIQ